MVGRDAMHRVSINTANTASIMYCIPTGQTISVILFMHIVFHNILSCVKKPIILPIFRIMNNIIADFPIGLIIPYYMIVISFLPVKTGFCCLPNLFGAG